MVIRLLGASAPKTFAGTILGEDMNAQAAAAEPLRSCRREILFVRSVLWNFNYSCLPFRKDIVFPCKTTILPDGLEKTMIPN
jgi:hypothetical protein